MEMERRPWASTDTTARVDACDMGLSQDRAVRPSFQTWPPHQNFRLRTTLRTRLLAAAASTLSPVPGVNSAAFPSC